MFPHSGADVTRVTFLANLETFWNLFLLTWFLCGKNSAHSPEFLD
jgi:hypothetical protein